MTTSVAYQGTTGRSLARSHERSARRCPHSSHRLPSRHFSISRSIASATYARSSVPTCWLIVATRSALARSTIGCSLRRQLLAQARVGEDVDPLQHLHPDLLGERLPARAIVGGLRSGHRRDLEGFAGSAGGTGRPRPAPSSAAPAASRELLVERRVGWRRRHRRRPEHRFERIVARRRGRRCGSRARRRSRRAAAGSQRGAGIGCGRRGGIGAVACAGSAAAAMSPSRRASPRRPVAASPAVRRRSNRAPVR